MKILSLIFWKNPKNIGYFDQIWDCNLLAAVFGKEHNMDLYRDVIWRILRRRNFSFKRPETMHPKVDSEIKKNKRRTLVPGKKYDLFFRSSNALS